MRLTKVLKNHASPNTPRRLIITWHKHGSVRLFLPPRDLTQCMDVSPNTGPTLAHVLACKRACLHATHVPVQGMQLTQPNPSNQRLFTVADNEPRFVYQRKDLLAFNVAKRHRLESEVLLKIKAMGISRCRVNKTESETSREMHNNQAERAMPIPVRITNKHRTNRIPRSRNKENLLYVDIDRRQQINQPKTKLWFAVWKAQSLHKKSGLLCDIVLSNRLDVFAITETWLICNSNNEVLAEILNVLKDFTVLQVPRENSRGRGVALFFSLESTY